MVPGWFRAFRLELVSNDKIILCDSPTASYGSGMVPGWFRTLRLPLVSNSKITLRETSMASDGSGVAPCDSPGAFSNDQVALRDCPPLPMSPGWLRGGSTRFASGLSAREKSHFRRRPRLPPTPAATLGPARGSADARVMPRRSGPKRLGSEHCGVALTTPSQEWPSLLFLTPGRGGVFPRSSTRQHGGSHERASQCCARSLAPAHRPSFTYSTPS